MSDDKSDEDTASMERVNEIWGFWSKANISSYRIRSKNYLETGEKIPSEPLLFDLLHMEAFIGEHPLVHLAARKFSWYSKNKAELGCSGFFFIYSIRVASIGCSVVSYHYIGDKAMLPKLFQDFLSKGAEFRKSRLKMIPKITEGPWLVMKTVPIAPVIVGNKVDVTYYIGDNYIEVDMLCDTSKLASSIITLATPMAKKVVTEIVWTVEGHEGELPERLFAGCRFGNLDFEKFTKVIYNANKIPVAIENDTSEFLPEINE